MEVKVKSITFNISLSNFLN